MLAESTNSHPRCAKRCRSLTLKSQDTQRAGSIGQDCSFMPGRSFAVSKSILVSLGHVLTKRPFSIGIGPKQVRPKVLNATLCAWPPAADKRKEELRMLAALPAVKASLSPRSRYNYSSQVSNLISFGPPLLLSSILHAQPL